MKEPDEFDFPAAHSMDTSWFGMDDEGNIGEFTSGEAGAMPLKAALNSNNWHPGACPIYLDDLLTERDERMFSYNYGRRPIHEIEDRLTQDVWRDCLVWLSSTQVLEEWQSDPIQLIVKKDHKKYRNELDNILKPLNCSSPVVILNIASAQVIRDLTRQKKISRAWINFWPEIWRFGIYEYRHDHKYENWIAGPYVLQHRPENALNVKHLPEEIQVQLAKVEFVGLQFEAGDPIQPFEHLECTCWGGQWVDSIGDVHDL